MQRDVATSVSDPHRHADTTWLVACAWCSRIRVGDRWLVATDAAGAFSADETACPPSVTHTICPECFDRTESDAANARTRSAPARRTRVGTGEAT